MTPRSDLRIPVRYVERPGYSDSPLRERSRVIELVIGFDPAADMDDKNPPKGKFSRFKLWWTLGRTTSLWMRSLSRDPNVRRSPVEKTST